MVERRILTDYYPKPIPDRNFDWTATWNDYDLGQPIGTGATEQEAIDDLREITEWRDARQTQNR